MSMSEQDVGRVLTALKAGEFRLSVHAAERMTKRSVTKADIQACGQTAVDCVRQSGKKTFRVENVQTVLVDLPGELMPLHTE